MRSEYKYEVDRFDGDRTSTAHFNGSDCKLVERLKGELFACFMSFGSVSEDGSYRDGASLTFMKKSRGWDLMSYGTQSSLPAIITYKDGTTQRTKLKTVGRLYTKVLYGGTVSEAFSVRLPNRMLTKLSSIKSIEVKYASAVAKWKPNKHALCVANVAPSC